MQSKTRQIYTGVFRFVLVSLLALVLLLGTTFLIAAILAYWQNSFWNHPGNLCVGLVCGLSTWLFVAIFHLQQDTQTLPISQRDPFLAEAKAILTEMGYTLSSQLLDDFSFRPSFHSFLFGGAIRLSFEARIAKITGPKVSLEIFRRLYRLQHHVQRVQNVLHEQRRFTDNLLKRVELRLRVKPEQLDGIARNVLALLQQDGKVICDLNVLAQSEHGIKENVVEFQIREWLEQHAISCEIHKDLIQFVEVVDAQEELESPCLHKMTT